LLLEQTGWGKSNERTMTRALQDRAKTVAITKWFNWGLTVESARILIREINLTDADGIFLVANANEGKAIAKAMASLPEKERLPIFSHWGITGGDFAEKINNEIRKQLHLHFIQTSFSFLHDLNTFQQNVLEKSYELFPSEIKKPEDIKAPTGFIHAYDLTRIFITAANQVKFGNDIKANRNALRLALENIQQPVEGLIKIYKKPFTSFSESKPDAHEALGLDNYTMGYFGQNNEIIISEDK